MSSGGFVIAVCLGPGGLPKLPVSRALVGPGGLVGDGHRSSEHGGPTRAVCLLSIEETQELEAEGVGAQPPGGYGENLLLEGLDFGDLRPGDQLVLEAGGPGERAAVWLELTDVRAPCGTLKQVDPRFPDLMLGRSGFLARVLQGGALEPGMHVTPGEYKTP